MTRSDAQRLDDMREHCARIGRLVGRGRDAFEQDEAVRFAMERSMEIIGEAANEVREATRASHPDIEWQRITRFRVLLAHHYHRVDPGQIWTIAVADIPALARALGPPHPAADDEDAS